MRDERFVYRIPLYDSITAGIMLRPYHVSNEGETEKFSPDY